MQNTKRLKNWTDMLSIGLLTTALGGISGGGRGTEVGLEGEENSPSSGLQSPPEVVNSSFFSLLSAMMMLSISFGKNLT